MRAHRILVVDDEPQILRALRTALTGHGYEVDLANDGEEGLAILAARMPDLLVLDLMLPGIDGLEVIEQSRQWSDLPIIVLSARGEEALKVRALDLGADDYLTKPFGISELIARVRALLRRGKEAATPVVEFGPISVDFSRHVVSRDGKEIHLTPTEYDLLAAFAQNTGKVMTHRQLLERVWGGYAAENTQQLRVYINYLRRKLEDDPSHPRWIVTEPGVGYRLRIE
jgi:two-component system KDP operon response regulator KdpE